MAVFGPEGDLPDPPAWTTPHFSVRASAMGCPRCVTSSLRRSAVLEPRLVCSQRDFLRSPVRSPSNHLAPVAHAALPRAQGFVLAGHLRHGRHSPDRLHRIPSPRRGLRHVDVRAEVTASSASRGGAVLLIDASQGTPPRQSPTSTRLRCARRDPARHPRDRPKRRGCPMCPRPARGYFRVRFCHHYRRGPSLNVQSLVPLAENVPALEGVHMKPLRMLLDSWCDELRGVICLVRVFDGTVCAVGLAAAQVGYICHRA
ncbi:translation factor guf1- mitochondrial [Apiospora marii]|uniref:Translation factor guf1- mitochondrial n=1 Tax=Apiospora marii TaxID=335849 RepID=A0ABR1RL62_9PEZI